jgi:cold shock CspA family protein
MEIKDIFDLKYEGVIHWFDDTSGEGMVACTDGKSYYLHWSAIKGTFPPKNGKPSWASVKAGWRVAFNLLRDTTFSQVSELYVVEECEPRPSPSIYTDRAALKAELAAIQAMISEEWPEEGYDFDEYYRLTRKASKLTEKEELRLSEIEGLRDVWNQKIKELRERKTMLVVATYRKYSRFYSD